MSEVARLLGGIGQGDGALNFICTKDFTASFGCPRLGSKTFNFILSVKEKKVLLTFLFPPNPEKVAWPESYPYDFVF